MPADSLASVARDLALLAASDRRAILAALDSDDRDRMRSAMRGEQAPARENLNATTHSVWFNALVATARDPQGDSPSAAARAALLDALGDSASATTPRPPGRSLLQAAGGFLAGARPQ